MLQDPRGRGEFGGLGTVANLATKKYCSSVATSPDIPGSAS